MSSLVGAWSLSDRAIADLLSDEQRRAMLAPLGAAWPVCEVRYRRLWLRAAAGRLVEDHSGVLAVEGFVVPEDLRQVLKGQEPDGHHVRVRYRFADKALVLGRSFSGGERLYFTRLGEVLLFASSVRALLGHPGLARRLHIAVLDEVLMCGLVEFGAQTLHRGVDELLAGHEMRVGAALGTQSWHGLASLAPAAGPRADLGRVFRERLTEAVVAAAGSARPVPVALSGGIDSSAIAAAAVDAFGAGQVQAITYEFDDPGHNSELDFARLVVERLGITRHHVFKLEREAYLAAIPEMIWRSESLVHWPKAFMLLVARELRRLGFERVLTGFGIGSHMAFCGELAAGIELVGAGLLSRHWRAARFGYNDWPDRLRFLHPALEAPHPRLYHQVLRLLEHAGLLRGLGRFFPRRAWPVLESGRDLNAIEPGLSALPLRRRLELTAFSHLMSCIDVTRSEKASRELGVTRIAPAHFAACIPYAYFPIEPRPRLGSDARVLRPGKALLREGFRGVIPDEVLFRVKSWGDAVASPAWLQAGRRLMLDCLPMFPRDAKRYGPAFGDFVPWWESRSLLATGLALRLWERLFIELPLSSEPPSWESLRASLGRPTASARR